MCKLGQILFWACRPRGTGLRPPEWPVPCRQATFYLNQDANFEMTRISTKCQARGLKLTHPPLYRLPATPCLPGREVPRKGHPKTFDILRWRTSPSTCAGLPSLPCQDLPLGCCTCFELGSPPSALTGKTIPSKDGGLPLSCLDTSPGTHVPSQRPDHSPSRGHFSESSSLAGSPPKRATIVPFSGQRSGILLISRSVWGAPHLRFSRHETSPFIPGGFDPGDPFLLAEEMDK